MVVNWCNLVWHRLSGCVYGLCVCGMASVSVTWVWDCIGGCLPSVGVTCTHWVQCGLSWCEIGCEIAYEGVP